MAQKQVQRKNEEMVEVSKKDYTEIMQKLEEFMEKMKELKIKKEIEESREQEDIPHEEAMKIIGLE